MPIVTSQPPLKNKGMLCQNEIIGSWVYRSFINDQSLLTSFEKLRFGAGVMQLEMPRPGVLSGTLGGQGWSLAIQGIVSESDEIGLAFEGKGEIGGEPWIYAYTGWLVPDWPKGVDQIDAIVGSVMRGIPHSSGQAPAGYVASFVAVREPVSNSN